LFVKRKNNIHVQLTAATTTDYIAGWSTYRAYCDRNNISLKKQLELHYFRLEITQCLVSEENTVKRLNASDCPEAPIYKRRCKYKPPTPVCLDSIGNVPLWDEKNTLQGAKTTNVRRKPIYIYCKKCNIHLCLTKVTNCQKEKLQYRYATVTNSTILIFL
jgi:hypothetical protein